MSRTRVKICGLTRVEDALQAASLGADALGLVFYEPSPRNISVPTAQRIVSALPPFVTTVGLFVNPSREEVERVLESVHLDRLQFHGDESNAFCTQFDKPFVKALRARPGTNLVEVSESYTDACGILIDSYKPGVPGGTGETFDWASIPDILRPQIILAGGLTPDNVRRAVVEVQPAAVDVSGGVESAPGIKSPEKVRAFIEAVNCD